MKKKLTIAVSSLVVTAVLLLVVVSQFSSKDNNSTTDVPDISRIHASFAIDINNKQQTVGDADYVFVAKVLKEEKTIYKNPIKMESENGYKKFSSPYTVYSIEVIDNLKGKLKKNKPFEIQKSGGLSEDGKTYYLFDQDELLKEDSFYILLGYAQKDGSIIISGPNSSVHLDNKTNADIVSSSEYKEYMTAIRTEVKRERERFKATVEE